MPSVAATSTTAGNNTNNKVIVADGSGNQRIYAHSNGCVGVGLGNNQIPQNRFEINSSAAGIVAGTTGLRFRNFTNTNYSTAAPTTNRRVLTVNNVGDVILVDDVVGTVSGTTFTSTCGTNNFVPKSTGSSSMVCSQIFDDGTSVGIGTTSNFGFISGTTPGTLFQSGTGGVGNGTFKLDVNGVTRSVAFWASSDEKFKKDIKAINNSLEVIQKLDGKTYLWNKQGNKELGFDDGLHSGFIAQELEKVMPHLVATDEKGNKAVNYMELMPYLVEAIKEQQIQINDLKNQLIESFRNQNQELITLTNTKIISVSPNPSKDVISVSFNIEKSVQNAKLEVYDLKGNLLSSLNVKERDANLARTFQKDNFGIGIYIVSLMINGKSIDAKKIIFE
ncbi:tail fiber domain-containing protein [Flavobacterium sedimenticola]|nr:tail fiber domain-containing protein [Flavobacterium sedimenticola]